MAIGYVHQRVEIIKAGYALQKNREHLSELVDRNSKLMYDLSRLESPRYLLTSLDSEEVEFANHRIRQANRYQLAHVDSGSQGADENFVVRFLDLFTLNAEAKPQK